MSENKSFNNSIVIDDGTVEEIVVNKFGQKIGVLHLIPTDYNIVARYNEVIDTFKDIFEPLENADINPDGSGALEDDFAIIKAAEQRLYEKFDYIFGEGTAKTFFDTRAPFARRNGRFYCYNVLDSLGKYIIKKYDVEEKRGNERVKQYTQAYKPHKNGKKKGNKR